MELLRRTPKAKLRNLFSKVVEDNLFLLSSSVSYYSALAIAPFLLILLGVASLIGGDVQNKVIGLSSDFSPEVGQLIEIIFTNVNEGVSVGSISGVVGLVVLLWTSSLVFLQLRYSLDLIYGHHDSQASVSFLDLIKERAFAMSVVILAGLFLIVSSSLPGLARFLFQGSERLVLFKSFAFLINIFVYVALFWLIHYLVPSKRPGKREALKMGLLSSLFFILGNMFLAQYFRGVASDSIYGAAGSLLVFLVWTYYSSFTLFLSVEVFIYLRKIGKVK